MLMLTSKSWTENRSVAVAGETSPVAVMSVELLLSAGPVDVSDGTAPAAVAADTR